MHPWTLLVVGWYIIIIKICIGSFILNQQQTAQIKNTIQLWKKYSDISNSSHSVKSFIWNVYILRSLGVLFIYLFVLTYLFDYLLIYLYMYSCIYVYLFIYSFIYLLINCFIYLSIYRFICLFIWLIHCITLISLTYHT